MKSIISFGEVLFDVFHDSVEIGGAPLNFAAHFAKLGGKAYILSAVGKDTLGDEAVKYIKNRGVSTELISVSRFLTGRCEVTLDENRIPSYDLLTNVAYDDISADVTNIRSLSADAFYFGTLAQRSQSNRNLLKEILSSVSFEEIFCDMNIRKGCYDRSSILFALENATILKFSDDDLEESALAESVECDRSELPCKIASLFPNIRIILHTLGKDGSEILETRSGKLHAVAPVINKNPVSTVGAGDSYGAAFLVNFLDGKSIEECGRAASEISSYVVGIKGAI